MQVQLNSIPAYALCFDCMLHERFAITCSINTHQVNNQEQAVTDKAELGAGFGDFIQGVKKDFKCETSLNGVFNGCLQGIVYAVGEWTPVARHISTDHSYHAADVSSFDKMHAHAEHRKSKALCSC
eukprot:SAG31_NODE_8143_length_1512_cov_1.191083_2_plen_126_part_00